MEHDIETIRERITNVARADQEPKDRLWAAIAVLAIIMLCLGGFLIEIRAFLGEGRGLSFERTAAECLDLVVDNDRTFDLPQICSDSRVVVHFPPEVCTVYFADVGICGTEWED